MPSYAIKRGSEAPCGAGKFTIDYTGTATNSAEPGLVDIRVEFVVNPNPGNIGDWVCTFVKAWRKRNGENFVVDDAAKVRMCSEAKNVLTSVSTFNSNLFWLNLINQRIDDLINKSISEHYSSSTYPTKRDGAMARKADSITMARLAHLFRAAIQMGYRFRGMPEPARARSPLDIATMRRYLTKVTTATRGLRGVFYEELQTETNKMIAEVNRAEQAQFHEDRVVQDEPEEDPPEESDE